MAALLFDDFASMFRAGCGMSDITVIVEVQVRSGQVSCETRGHPLLAPAPTLYLFFFVHQHHIQTLEMVGCNIYTIKVTLKCPFNQSKCFTVPNVLFCTVCNLWLTCKFAKKNSNFSKVPFICTYQYISIRFSYLVTYFQNNNLNS